MSGLSSSKGGQVSGAILNIVGIPALLWLTHALIPWLFWPLVALAVLWGVVQLGLWVFA